MSVIVRQARDQNMAPRLPRPMPVLPGSSRPRPGGPKCYKKCKSLKFECAQEIRRRLNCCRRRIGTQPTEQYATAISQELRTVFK